MRNLPPSIVKVAGKTSTASAWLMLLVFSIDGNTIRIVDNPEDVVFDGDTYTAGNFGISSAQESSDGQMTSWSIVITDVSRLLAPTLEDYDGAIGATVTLVVVNSKLLAENYAEITRVFTVRASNVDGDQMTLMLSGSNLLVARHPRYRYIGKHCNWVYGTAECGASGGSCDRTYANCVSNSNEDRFGGYLGLQSGTIRFA